MKYQKKNSKLQNSMSKNIICRRLVHFHLTSFSSICTADCDNFEIDCGYFVHILCKWKPMQSTTHIIKSLSSMYHYRLYLVYNTPSNCSTKLLMHSSEKQKRNENLMRKVKCTNSHIHDWCRLLSTKYANLCHSLVWNGKTEPKVKTRPSQTVTWRASQCHTFRWLYSCIGNGNDCN